MVELLLGMVHNAQLLLTQLWAKWGAKLLGVFPISGNFSARSWQKKDWEPCLKK